MNVVVLDQFLMACDLETLLQLDLRYGVKFPNPNLDPLCRFLIFCLIVMEMKDGFITSQ
jgi:hypothetical protein